MEKELNIAAILKEKPTETKLWSPMLGDCIPYNEETAHLLGTTDEWKGGE